jgi:hypothetical protein
MFTRPRRKTAVSLSAKAATGAGTTIDLGSACSRDLRYFIAATGVTTGATIKVEVSHDGSTWYVFGSSIAISASGNTHGLVSTQGAGIPRYVRLNITARTDGTYTGYLEADIDN